MAAKDIRRPHPEAPPCRDRATGCWARRALFAFGWLNVALAIVGMILPGVPTTVFLIIAAWAFSRCSERFHRWLWHHPRLGANVRAWHRHRVIPRRAKTMAVGMMAISFVATTAFIADGWIVPAIMMATMIPAAVYIVTRPNIVDRKI